MSELKLRPTMPGTFSANCEAVRLRKARVVTQTLKPNSYRMSYVGTESSDPQCQALFPQTVKPCAYEKPEWSHRR